MSEPNYHEMYYQVMREMEMAIDILIKAQLSCEERYLAAGEDGLLHAEASKTDHDYLEKHLSS